MRKWVEIDFEFNGTKEHDLNLVCCSLSLIHGNEKKETREYWLHSFTHNKQILAEELCKLDDEGYIFLAHAVSAEAASFISLGLDPSDFKWIDTFIEFRMLTNHNDELTYRDHYIDGKVITKKKPRPKWMQADGESSGGKLTHSLSQAVYVFLGIKIDTDHKTKMRDIIISCDEDLIEENKDDIQKYCTSDIEYLHPMLMKMVKHYKRKRIPKEGLIENMLWRGETCARTAIIERTGYPFNYKQTQNFSRNVPSILKEIQKHINKTFPDIAPFVLDKKTRNFVRKEKPIKEWIKSQGLESKWRKTKTKNLSLSMDAFKDHFDYRHSYPEDCFGAQMVRLLHTKQNLNGFLPAKEGKSNFWDSVGKDRICRPYLNPYGSQSARYQPSATGFIPLKSAWMRTLIHPPKGKMIVSIDYKSQEFLIAARLSNDTKMLHAYATGDPYLEFGKQAKAIPMDGTKKSHPIMRQSCKSTVLGLSFSMTEFGLSKKLTTDTGKFVSEEEALNWVNLFNSTFYDHFIYKKQLIADYQRDGKLTLPDGWVMFGDNRNDRSVGNCPIQGFGSCILRKAIQLIQDESIDFIMPLHDAGYIMVDLNDWETVETFAVCMDKAFDHYFTEDQRKVKVGLDCEAWGDGLQDGETTLDSGLKVKTEPFHVDERAQEEYNHFSKYFNPPDYELL